MKIKFTLPCLALLLLMTTANHGRADQAPQNGKTSAARIPKEFEALSIESEITDPFNRP